MTRDELIELMRSECCSHDRKGWGEPFIDGEHLYATDGRIALRIPKHGCPPASVGPSRLRASHLSWNAGTIEHAWPYAEVYERECSCESCAGTGELHAQCPRCDHRHRVRYGGVCVDCDGAGTWSEVADMPLPGLPDGECIKGRYYQLINRLPGLVRYGVIPGDGGRAACIVRFTFGGGEGLLATKHTGETQ